MNLLLDPNQIWHPQESAAFCKTGERYGRLSNMAAGFPLERNGVRYQSPEGFYQALKFLHRPELQQLVAAAANAYQSKQTAYRHKTHFRKDWEQVKLPAMALTLAAKLKAHPQTFGAALKETGELHIVEISTKDAFWGAKPGRSNNAPCYRGANVLGQMLTDLATEWFLHPEKAVPTFLAEYDTSQLLDPSAAAAAIAPAPPPAPKEKEKERVKVLVCGGRSYADAETLNRVLDDLHSEFAIIQLIEGDAPGADRLAGQWAERQQLPHRKFPAKWRQYGKGAGYLRNKEMIEVGRPDLVVAFPGGPGTANMVALARAAGVPVRQIS